MATEGGGIDFMFLGPPPYPAAGSATDLFLVFGQHQKSDFGPLGFQRHAFVSLSVYNQRI